MRTLLFVFTIVILGIPTHCFCQFNLSENGYSFDNDTLPSNATQSNFPSLGGGGIACNPNSFFAVSTTTGSIDELTLVGNTVVFSSSLLAPNGPNLAYSNNLNVGSFSPTFYSSNPGYISYFDGTEWIDMSSGDVYLFNPGANGNYLYYSVATETPVPQTIVKYDGTNLDTIYVFPPDERKCVADLAVDIFGNIIFAVSTGTFDFQTDKIVIISPSGEVLNEYPFIYDCHNLYGSFLLNGVYYLGLGPNHPDNPNTLLPITFSGDSVIVGTPLDMPATVYIDLASCNVGALLFVDKIIEPNNDFTVYPKPVNSHLTMNFTQGQTKTTVRIINLLGEEIKAFSINGRELTIERGNIESGIYFVQAIDENGRITNKKVVLN